MELDNNINSQYLNSYDLHFAIYNILSSTSNTNW